MVVSSSIPQEHDGQRQMIWASEFMIEINVSSLFNVFILTDGARTFANSSIL